MTWKTEKLALSMFRFARSVRGLSGLQAYLCMPIAASLLLNKHMALALLLEECKALFCHCNEAAEGWRQSSGHRMP